MPDIAVPFFTAVPAAPPPWPGIVVVMEGNGISPQLLRVCQRLAHEGYATVAPDLYWRSGGSDPDKTMEQMGALHTTTAWPTSPKRWAGSRTIGATKVGATGFCMGGGYTYLSAVSGDGRRGRAVLRRRHRAEPRRPRSARCSRSSAATTNGSRATRSPQVEAHHPGDVIVYEDAEHGFMRDGSDNYHETAATDAWQRMLAFFAQHLREH